MPVTYLYKTFAKKFGMYCLIHFVSKCIQIVNEFCLRFIYIRVKVNTKAMLLANYCIVPDCVYTKAMFEWRKIKEKSAFAFTFALI